MSGSGSNPFSAPPTSDRVGPGIEIPVPDDPIELNGALPQIIRLIVDRLNEISGQTGSLSQSQLATQQALNLLQSAHNSLHENLQQGGTATGAGDRFGRKRVMEAKLTVPVKFSGAPSDPMAVLIFQVN